MMLKKTGGDTGCCGTADPVDQCRAEMPPADEIKRQAEFMKGISDPARIRIVYALKNRELCVCELMKIVDMPQTVVSHHLKVLKYADIITDRRSGKWIYYSLTDTRASSVLDAIKEG
jgi:ArsR family transcriptional regulator